MTPVAFAGGVRVDAVAPAAGVHRFSRLERVSHGQPVADALRTELERLGARRVLVVTNRSLAAGNALAPVRAALGDAHAGSYDRVTAHVPRAQVIEGADAARRANADLLVAVGGGSVIDAAKVMLLALRHDLRDEAALDAFADRRPADVAGTPADAARWLRVVAVPTTLSGAEFAASAGATDPVRRIKQAYAAPMMVPVAVILDPAMAATAPPRLLLATGVKALDHAVERITSAAANPFSDAASLPALRLLADALPRLHRDVSDRDAHASAQYGMFLSVAGAASGAAVNLGHAIGHVLGAHCGVPHGETSCVLMPAVMRWCSPACGERPRWIADALGAERGVDAADALARWVASLGLPGRLREVGVRHDDIDAIAAKAMHEPLRLNARLPVTPQAIATILHDAW